MDRVSDIHIAAATAAERCDAIIGYERAKIYPSDDCLSFSGYIDWYCVGRRERARAFCHTIHVSFCSRKIGERKGPLRGLAHTHARAFKTRVAHSEEYAERFISRAR